ncbi:MAG: hypothetical protein A2633_06545 [Candidatus Sungbacteria bacterium RIFCSPHIGHO2_01_FULL_47_32]|uniref:Uncharacterized protein n=1 Tax=Candidatus Sungbacteria bacterium RIFCSPHIGHO2_01_FULL_47_32 TaxID=1802264 RepID=A0A1G2KAY0_9BACT|nr:MAG: hypothetical protein A2633_06545 [Candidatus Sungbacteria bacterium RIFCSPHIGHO2_01_FULL_47_32]
MADEMKAVVLTNFTSLGNVIEALDRFGFCTLEMNPLDVLTQLLKVGDAVQLQGCGYSSQRVATLVGIQVKDSNTQVLIFRKQL